MSSEVLNKDVVIEQAGAQYHLTRGEDGAPLVKDLELARWLGFERSRKIRELINRWSAELGHVSPYRGAKPSGPEGGRPEEGYLLTEQQALFIAAKSETPRATEILKQIIAVFVAVRQGVAEHKTPAALPPGWSMRKLADIMDKVCNKLREAAEQREFVSDGRLDRLCEILSATTETVEEAARRAKWKEQGLLIQLDKLNAEVEDRRQAFAMWSQSTEKVLHRLGSKQGESIEEALNRWLGEHTKNLQTNRNTLRLYEAAMELCEGGMVPSEQIIKLRGLVNTLQQKLASARLQTARLAAVMPAIFPDWPSDHNKTDFEWALSQVKAEIERLRSYLVKPEAEQADDYLRTQLVRLGTQRDHLLSELEKKRREVTDLRTRSELAAQSFARHTGWVHLKESKQTPRHVEPAQILAFIVQHEGSERRWDATLCEPCAPPDETEVTVPGPDAP